MQVIDCSIWNAHILLNGIFIWNGWILSQPNRVLQSRIQSQVEEREEKY